MMQRMIHQCVPDDFDQIWNVINEGAQAYKGVIPADRWTEPYMTRKKLQQEIGAGVTFWAYWQNNTMIGVMGIQAVQDVTLIRHAYVHIINTFLMKWSPFCYHSVRHILSSSSVPIQYT